MANLTEVAIQYDGYEITVKGWYTEEEPMVMYYSDMSGYPGAPATFDITEVIAIDTMNGNQEVEQQEFLDNVADLDTLEELVLERLTE